MAKVKKQIQFSYPLTQPSKVNGAIRFTHLGDLTVIGVAYDNQVPAIRSVEDGDRYDIEIEKILWGGVDILPVLDYKDDDFPTLMEEIQNAAQEHAADEFAYPATAFKY